MHEDFETLCRTGRCNGPGSVGRAESQPEHAATCEAPVDLGDITMTDDAKCPPKCPEPDLIAPKSKPKLAQQYTTVMNDSTTWCAVASERQRKKLERIFSISEEEERQERLRNGKAETWPFRDERRLEMAIDTFMAVVISANSLFLGLFLDHTTDEYKGGWLLASGVFTVLFWLELVMKIYLHGVKEFFCGSQCIAHCYDVSL